MVRLLRGRAIVPTWVPSRLLSESALPGDVIQCRGLRRDILPRRRILRLIDKSLCICV